MHSNKVIRDPQLEADFTEAMDKIISAESRRTINITFRITPEESRRLKEICQGVKLSRYIRAGLFGYPQPRPRQVMPQVNRDTYIQLKRLNNNINQQTKAINTALKIGLAPAIGDTYLKELAEVRKLLQQNLSWLIAQASNDEGDDE